MSTNVEGQSVSPNDAKPRVSGSLLLLELMQVAAIKNEERLNIMLEYQFPTIDEAGVIC